MDKTSKILVSLIFLIALIGGMYGGRLFFGTPNLPSQNYYRVLGVEKGNQTWVYLCGLTDSFDNGVEQEDQVQLDFLGKKLHFTILALYPPARCSLYDNKLCWPHDSAQEIISTHEYIQSILPEKVINGFIGFSNGAFFLLYLAQYFSLPYPLIAIGAGVQLNHFNSPCNQITLIIGKQDYHHYALASQFYEQALKAGRTINLIEHEEGHIIPLEILEEVLKFYSK